MGKRVMAQKRQVQSIMIGTTITRFSEILTSLTPRFHHNREFKDMQIVKIALTALLLSTPSVNADDIPRIIIIDSTTPAKALIDKPGTFLGETFVFSEEHTADVQVQIGVWEAGIGKLTFDDFSFTEYVLMIGGSVIVTETNGVSMTFDAGDTFVIPKGWSGTWDVQERMKKQIVRIGNGGQ